MQKQSWLYRSNLDILLLVVLYCVIFFVVALPSQSILYDPDIGTQLSKGRAILHGQHPFLDIDNSVYGPAIFYISALAQLIYSQSVFPEVVVIFIGYLIAYLLFFIALKKYSGKSLYLIVFGVLCLIAFPRFHKYHTLIGPAVFFAGLYYTLGIEKPYKAVALLAMLSVIAGVFRIDFGVYCVVSSLLYIGLRYWQDSYKQVSKLILGFILTGAILLSPWLIFLALNKNIIEIFELFYKTSVGVHSSLKIPLPRYDFGTSPFAPANELFITYWLLKLLPVMIVLGLCLKYVRGWRDTHLSAVNNVKRPRQSIISKRDIYLFVCSAAAMMFFLQASHRIGLPHIKQVFPPVLFVSVLAISRLAQDITAKKMLVLNTACLCALVVFIHTLKHPLIFSSHKYSFPRISSLSSSWMLTRDELIERMIRTPYAHRNPMPGVIKRVRGRTDNNDHVLFLPFMAQAYYFSERTFNTPFGWLNPGRFIYPGSERRFIDRMKSTSHIVDWPAFAFDGLPSRNMRNYAPMLSRHIYTKYGIYDTVGQYVLLSTDREIWHRGSKNQYSFKLITNFDGSEKGINIHGVNGSVSSDVSACDEAGSELVTLNTLPINKYGKTYKMPHRAGMLLSARSCKKKVDRMKLCTSLGLSGMGGIYALGDKNGHPVILPGIKSNTIIRTSSLPRGNYEFVYLIESPCATNQINNGLTSFEKIVKSGIHLELWNAPE